MLYMSSVIEKKNNAKRSRQMTVYKQILYSDIANDDPKSSGCNVASKRRAVNAVSRFISSSRVQLYLYAIRPVRNREDNNIMLLKLFWSHVYCHGRYLYNRCKRFTLYIIFENRGFDEIVRRVLNNRIWIVIVSYCALHGIFSLSLYYCYSISFFFFFYPPSRICKTFQIMAVHIKVYSIIIQESKT